MPTENKTSVVADPQTVLDASKMSAVNIITSQNPDASGDVVVVAGVDLTRYIRQPVVLFAHDPLQPIGRSVDVLKTDTDIRATTQFDQNSMLATQVFALLEDGIMKGISIGYVPKRVDTYATGTDEVVVMNGDRLVRERFGLIFHEIELVEVSHLMLGDNPDAMTVLVQKGRLKSEVLHPTLFKTLSPYILQTPVSVSVPELKLETKAVADEYVPIEETEKPPVDEETEVEEPAEDDRPPGAKFLDGLFTRVLEMGQYLDEEGSGKKQESMEVRNYVADMMERIDSLSTEVADLYAELYPDCDALTKEVDDAEDVVEEEPAEKKMRRVLKKKIDVYRTIHVGFKPIPINPIDATKLAAIQKQLDALAKSNAKLVKQLRAARHGR